MRRAPGVRRLRGLHDSRARLLLLLLPASVGGRRRPAASHRRCGFRTQARRRPPRPRLRPRVVVAGLQVAVAMEVVMAVGTAAAMAVVRAVLLPRLRVVVAASLLRATAVRIQAG